MTQFGIAVPHSITFSAPTYDDRLSLTLFANWPAFSVTSLRISSLFVAALVLVAVAYLGLRPSPFIAEVSWIPSWLGKWADHHGVFRSTVAFFALGVVYFGLVGRRWPHPLALALFATALEVAQRWIPHRVFDPLDIIASIVGLALAWPLVWLTCALRQKFRA